jgi:cutinase
MLKTDNGDPVAGVAAPKTKVICHAADNICQGGATILPAHLTYGTQDSGAAAAFVADVAPV